jgi:hypothetical protein
VDVTLNSVFASRKRNLESEKAGHPAILPSTFQVYTKIDEESRKDNKLAISFLLTLNDTKGLVTYEFRGICNVSGTSADFESVMETNKNARVPKILDILYQKLYPAMFMLAGMTTSSYPQSIALLTDMVSSEPIPVRQEMVTVAQGGQEKAEASPTPALKEVKPTPAKPAITRVADGKTFKPKSATDRPSFVEQKKESKPTT